MTETLNETEQGDERIEGPAEDAPQVPDEPGVSDDDAPDAQPDEPVEPGAAPAPEPPPEAANDVAMEAVFEKAGKRAKTYMSAIPDILGEAAQDLSLCPRCTDFLPGWLLPLQIKPVSDEQRIAVKVSIGELIEPEFKAADDAFTCPKCDGRGKVATGSKVQGKETGKCLECGGDGWIGPRKARVAALPPEEQAALAAPNGDQSEAKPLADPWGRLKDDPLYGIMPGFERD